MHQQTEPRGVEVEIVHFGKHRPEEREPMTPTEEFLEGMDWLRNIRAQTQLLADHLRGVETFDVDDVTLTIDGIAAMVGEATHRITRAHALLRWQWADQAGANH